MSTQRDPRDPPERRPLPPERSSRLAGVAVLLALLAGCGESDAPVVVPSQDLAPQTPAERLIGLVAAAKDQRYTADYQLRTRGRADQTVSVRLARDGTWRVDLGSAYGDREVSYAGTRHGVFQCAMGGCFQIAEPGDRIPARYDPKVTHPFTDWLDELSDSRAPLTITRDTSLRAPSGECFGVESNAAALTPRIASGTYCFNTEGVLTGAQFSGRTLLLAGAPGEPPQSISLPGPITAEEPPGTSSPDASPSAQSPSGTGN